MKKIEQELDDCKKDCEKMEKVFNLGLKEIEGVLADKIPISDKTKIASNVLSAYGRVKSASIHEQAIKIMCNNKASKAKLIGTEDM